MLNALAVMAAAQKPQTFKTLVQPFLEQHCIDCHSDDSAEGEVSFEGIQGLDAENVGLWKRVWEQVALKEHWHSPENFRLLDPTLQSVRFAFRKAPEKPRTNIKSGSYLATSPARASYPIERVD